MNEALAAAVADAAVHAFIAQRCRRAYIHELRNGLQGIYASVDVLKRFAEGKASPNLQLDKVKELTRKALQAHDAELSRTVERIALPQDESTQIDVSILVRDVCSFLANDATTRSVTLKANATEPVSVHARPNRIRSAVLAVVVCAIDSLRGPGEISVGTRSASGRPSIELILWSQADALRGEQFWIVDTAKNLEGNWLWRAMQNFVGRDGGVLESKVVASERADFSVARSVELSYRAADPAT